jgi:OFA family oxalate/formate antiporter-like MFS transporter
MILLALLAGILWNLFAGLFYCWSVFVEPLELALDVSRTSVSTVFSVGVVCYALGMFLSPHILVRVSLPRLAAGLGLVAGCGLLIAGLGQSLAFLIVGFSVIFAVTIGVGYALALQTASLEMPVRRSLAISLSVTAFAGAALVWPAPLSALIASLGPFTVLLICAAVMAGTGLVCTLLLHLSGAKAPAASDAEATHLLRGFFTRQPRIFLLILSSFVVLALGGLMALSHAAGIATAFGIAAERAWLGPMMTSVGYVTACIVAGPVTDWLSGRRVMAGLAAVMTASLLALFLWPSAALSLVALALIGGSFGATAAVYPVAISSYYSVSEMARIYGRITLGYGSAGLVAPLAAGALYDWEGGYHYSLLIAAGFAAAGIIAGISLPRHAAKAG